MNQGFDLVIKNVRVVRPRRTSVDLLDIGVKDGKIALLAPDIRTDDAREVIDGKCRLAFPGCVDAHMHIGIYQPLAQDAVTESKAAATGGVTSSLNYVRTGAYYLNRGGPYRDFMREALRLAEDNFWVDYGFHVAPIESAHIEEMEISPPSSACPHSRYSCSTADTGCTDARDAQREFLMIPPEEQYDIAHFEFIMRSARRIMDAHPQLAPYVSVSLHCETAEIISAYTKIVEREGKLDGLGAYSAARPPHSEGLAIWIASYLAHETRAEHQPASPVLAQGDGGGADDARGLSAHRLPPRGHRRAPAARLRQRVRRAWEGQPADPPARGCRGAVGGTCLTAKSTGWSATTPAVRPRQKFGDQPPEHLARQVGVRRHRVPAVRSDQRGLASAACRTTTWRRC